MSYITRIAPSPTGLLHIGTARTGYFNWLAAKASGGKMILRIDNTDVDRNKQEYTDVILEAMKWLGLDYDEIFYQSDRTSAYLSAADILLRNGFARKLDNGAIALVWKDSYPDHWVDEIAGKIAINETHKEQVDGRLILVRGGDKLGQCTYQFCSVVDDWSKSINFIIRGVDHITNTAKQVCIWSALNSISDIKSPLPKFAHVGLVFKDKKKMSKRDGASSVLEYRDKGYHPEALLNFLLRLGWAPREDNKANSVLPRNRALELFLDGGSMRNVNCGFDQAKLDWFDKVYKRM